MQQHIDEEAGDPQEEDSEEALAKRLTEAPDEAAVHHVRRGSDGQAGLTWRVCREAFQRCLRLC